MTSVIEINDDDFQSSVIDSKTVTIVDFYATWCGPCKKMADIIEQIALEYQGKISVFKINTDNNVNSAKDFSISSLPTLLVFKDGEAKERLVGLMPKSKIIENIEKYI